MKKKRSTKQENIFHEIIIIIRKSIDEELCAQDSSTCVRITNSVNHADRLKFDGRGR